MRKLLIFTTICFGLVLSCGFKNSKKASPKKTNSNDWVPNTNSLTGLVSKEEAKEIMKNYYGDYKYIGYTNFSSGLVTEEEAKEIVENDKVSITESLFKNGDHIINNPEYKVMIITNSWWAEYDDPEKISYIYDFQTNRKLTLLFKVINNKKLQYTKYEVLENDQLLTIFDGKGFVLERE